MAKQFRTDSVVWIMYEGYMRARLGSIGHLKVDLSAMEVRMTWRNIGAMGLMETIMTLFDRVVD